MNFFQEIARKATVRECPMLMKRMMWFDFNLFDKNTNVYSLGKPMIMILKSN